MFITVKVEDGHALLLDPLNALRRVTQAVGSDWHARPIPEGFQRLERPVHDISVQADDDVEVDGLPTISVGHDCQAADDEKGHVRAVQRADNRLDAGQLHGVPSSSDGQFTGEICISTLRDGSQTAGLGS